MKSIRRSLGAFAVAAVIATSLALTPSEAQAKKVSFCDALQASIAAVNALPDNPFKEYLLTQLQSAFDTYCIN